MMCVFQQIIADDILTMYLKSPAGIPTVIGITIALILAYFISGRKKDDEDD